MAFKTYSAETVGYEMTEVSEVSEVFTEVSSVNILCKLLSIFFRITYLGASCAINNYMLIHVVDKTALFCSTLRNVLLRITSEKMAVTLMYLH